MRRGQSSSQRSQTRARRESAKQKAPESEAATAAVKIQTAYRLLRLTYLEFGASIFCTRSGRPAPYGSLLFSRGVGQQKTAKWLVLAESTKMTLLCHFIERCWKLSQPDLVVDLTGSMQDLSIEPRIAEAISDGMDDVIRSTSCWMMTGAFDAGLAKLAGSVVRKSGVNVPIIGVGVWDHVRGRNKLNLDSCGGDTVTYDSVDLAQRVKSEGSESRSDALYLNSDHSHFLFVDTRPARDRGGTVGADVKDTNLRARFVDAYSDRKHLPVVTLVVQGDLDTLESVLTAARGSTPIIIVTDSGGAADAIHKAVFPIIDDGSAVDDDEMLLERETEDETFNSPKALALLKELKELHEEHDGVLVTVYDWQNDEVESLSTIMLEAIVRILCQGGNRNSRRDASLAEKQGDAPAPAPTAANSAGVGELTVDALASALKLAVNWDRPQIARSLVERKMLNESEKKSVLALALQRAVERQRTAIVEMLLDANAPLGKVNLLPLFAQPDRYNFLADTELRTALGSRLKESAHRGIAEFLGDISPTLEALTLEKMKVPGGIEGMDRDDGEEEDLGDAQPDPARDIFFHSIICGHDELARTIWQRCKDPLHLALLGSFVCRRQAERIAVGQQDVRDRAEQLEMWACGALQHAPNQEVAYRVLSAPAISRHFGSLLDLALECEMKNFLSDRFSLSLISGQWIGVYEGSPARLCDDFSPVTLLLCTMVPFLFPILLEDVDVTKKKNTSDGKVRSEGALRMNMELVVRAQTAAHMLSKANQSLAVRDRDRRGSVSPVMEAKKGRHWVKKEGAPHISVSDTANEARRLICDLWLCKRVKHICAFYDIPAVKFVTRSAVHFCLLAIHFITLAQTSSPSELAHALDDSSVGFGGSSAVSSGTSSTSSKRPRGRLLQDATDELNLADVTDTDGYAPFELLNFTISEYVLFGFFLTIFLDRCHRSVKLAQQRRPGGDMLWLAATLLYVAAFILRMLAYMLSPEDGSYGLNLTLYRVYQCVLACNSIIVWLCSLPLLSLSPAFGTLTIVLKLMVRDVLLWGTLFAVIVAGFAGTYLGLAKAELYRQSPAPTLTAGSPWTEETDYLYDVHVRSHPIVAAVWAAFGSSEQDRFSVATDPLGILYTLVMGLGMSNLLVAMFTDSYVNVQSNAKVEYNFLRFQRITELHKVLLRTPPPLNLPFVLWDLVVFVCHWMSARRKRSKTLSHGKSVREDAEVLAHRLVELYVEAEDAAAESSVDGLLNSCRELLQDERANATSRYLKLSGVTTEMHAMISKLAATLPAVARAADGSTSALAPAAKPPAAAPPAAAAKPPAAAPAQEKVALVPLPAAPTGQPLTTPVPQREPSPGSTGGMPNSPGSTSTVLRTANRTSRKSQARPTVHL